MIILQQSRGALSSGDQCSLDLPFAETKSLTARIGPTPTFTRASAASFVGSDGLIKTAAANAPRFDHDPLTPFACKGLLIEESRTNLFSRSQEFDYSTDWVSTGVTVAANATTAPDGTLTADTLNESTALANHSIGRAFNMATGTTYVFSVFIKSNGRPYVLVRTNTASSEFDLSTGTVSVIGTGSPTITKFGNGWYRCAIQFVSNGSNVTPTVLMKDSIGGAVNYTGNGASGVYVWGAQVEAGAFATSYIPTTTASAVRSADVCSITGANFTSFCNQTEGTLSLKATILASTLVMGGVSLQAADRFNCSVTIQKNNSTTLSANVVLPYNSYAANFSFANATYGSESKTIIAFKQDNFAASSNGSTVLTDNAGAFATGTYPLNQMQIGLGGGTRMFGWISEIKYYRRRLSNAKLQALTV